MRMFVFAALTAAVVSVHAQHLEWTARYDGRDASADAAQSMAVDSWGNVYVTGYCWAGGSFHDYLTIKYSPSGDTLWVARLDGLGREIDIPYALALDDSGNVYVTGLSEDQFDSMDYLTIKYSSSGDSIWAARYDGPDELDDEAHAIAVDDSGNVYVTGHSRSTDGFHDYLTIKYNSSGDAVWTARYDGTMLDMPRDIAVDADCNVYVTGYSQTPTELDGYFTIKYGPDGDTLWTARYDGPGQMDRARALAIDNSGSVYVTGRSEDSLMVDGCVTIKYGPYGDSLWVQRFDGPGSSYHVANAIAVDHSGNVYVSGHCWNVYSSDYLLIKYSGSGDNLWVARYDGPGGEGDTASASVVDDSGNVYVTGASHAADPEWDFLTIKYSPSGDSLWTARYDGPVDGNDYPYAIVADNNGYVYVTGASVGYLTSSDFLTIKYSSATGVQESPRNSAGISEILRVFPNPFGRRVVISYFCPSQRHVSLELFDMAGRFLERIYEGQVARGHYSFHFNGAQLPQGVYFARLRTDSTDLVTKMIVLR